MADITAQSNASERLRNDGEKRGNRSGLENVEMERLSERVLMQKQMSASTQINEEMSPSEQPTIGEHGSGVEAGPTAEARAAPQDRVWPKTSEETSRPPVRNG
jgi:hypothetical protein